MHSAQTKILLGLALVVPALAITLGSMQTGQQQAPTFAYVSTEIILQQTPGFAQAESTWNAEVSIMRAELDALSQQLDSALTAFNQSSIGLSPSARQERQSELQQLNQQYQQRTTDAQTRAEVRQRELMEPLQERIRAVIDGLRAERNLGMVFDVSALGNNIMTADPRLDLTTVVVRRLQGGE
jgi:Skp family chaperone for outer membrane proteins